MKIAIIGARGFVGSSLSKFFQNTHDVTNITRDLINVLDPSQVKSFLYTNHFDVVINCAAVMTNNDLLQDARNNFGMFMNFYDNRKYFGKFINTASGAEFDRTMDITNVLENEIFNRMPSDSYGWGQNMKSRICVQTDQFYNIRIFNCFGRDEINTRIFPKFLSTKDKFLISNDRYFDYFSVQDLCKVVEHCVEHTWTHKDINAVYEEKYKISEVLHKFCTLKKIDPNFTIVSTSSNNYTGDSDKLKSLGIKLNGLHDSLLNY